MYSITIKNLGKSIKVGGKETILSALRRNHIIIPAVCGGLGICGTCRIKILEGDATKPTEREIVVLGNLTEKGWRLACQAYALSDLVIVVPVLHSKKSKVRKIKEFEIDPDFRIVPIDLDHDGHISIEEILIAGLSKIGLNLSEVDICVLRSLASFSSGKNVVLSYGKAIATTDKMTGYGLAIDIGTTTVAISLRDLIGGRLVDETSMINRQTVYGMDIISRISHCRNKDGLAELKKAVVETINVSLNKILKRNNVSKDEIYRVVVSGNSVMTHIFLGIDPTSLGRLPFKPVFRRMMHVKAREIGIDVHENADIITLPLLGSYIGGDLVGDILASDFLEYENSILIDIGTNGEVLLKKGEDIYATSVPAGPAFEGMGMRSGVIAKDGAIESFRIVDGHIVEYSTINNESPIGICGTGYIDILTELVNHRVLDKNGRFSQASNERLTIKDGLKVYIVEYSKNTVTGEDIVVTQKDVRNLQLALASFKIATKTLLTEAKISSDDIEKVIIAGDFGYKINFRNAIRIGLIPPVDSGKVQFIGNGSLTGAEMVLLSRKFKELASKLIKKVRVIDLRKHHDFQKKFIESLTIGWE